MDEKSNIAQTVRKIYAARRENDVDALMVFTDPDCSFRIVGNEGLGDMTKKAIGSAAVRQTLQALVGVWDFAKIETTSLHVDGDTAFAHRSGQVRFNPTGNLYDTEFVDKLTFRNGRLIELVEFIDTLQAAKIIGALKH
jgi:ketosteroid isomerase-like protein